MKVHRLLFIVFYLCNIIVKLRITRFWASFFWTFILSFALKWNSGIGSINIDGFQARKGTHILFNHSHAEHSLPYERTSFSRLAELWIRLCAFRPFISYWFVLHTLLESCVEVFFEEKSLPMRYLCWCWIYINVLEQHCTFRLVLLIIVLYCHCPQVVFQCLKVP